ncbi:MAG: ATP-binding protein [Longimicrobiales bacterium]
MPDDPQALTEARVRSGYATHLWWQIPVFSAVLALLGIVSLAEGAWEIPPGFYFTVQSGVAVGILWLFGLRLWPAVAFGAATVTLVIDGTSLHVLATAIGNTLEAVIVVYLLRRSFDGRFVAVADVRRFVIAAAVGAFVSGLFGTFGLWLTESQPMGELFRLLWIWSVGHFLGVVLVGAAIISLYSYRHTLKDRAVEGGLMLTAVLLLTTAFAAGPDAYPLQYLAYPVLIWAALRLTPMWVLVANATLTTAALLWTSLGVGPINQGSLSMNLAYAAIFSLTAWLTSVTLAAVVAEAEASHAERVGRESEYRAVVEQAAEGIIVLDSEGVCTDVNGAGARLLDRAPDEVIGRPMEDFVPEEVWQDVERILGDPPTSDPAQLLEWSYTDRDEPLWIEASVKRIASNRTQVFARDITRRHSLQRQVAEAQKMEAVGVLAGGVAHDFNNLLTVVLGQAGRALTFVEADSPAAACLEEVAEAARKSSNLTKQLLTFARKHAGEPTVLDINQVMEDRTAIIRQLLGERIRYVLTQDRTQSGHLWALIDPVEFEQVILNLVINAKDAMDAGGELSITTDAVASAQIGEAVRVRVRDVGHGMSSDTAKRIFEPFFTTKADRNRTGLGLAVSYGIVQNAGGVISCRSAPGKGTEFSLLLPRAEAPSAPVATPAAPTARSDGRGERILVIEDEDPVRELITIGLSEAGYTVLGAPDGQSALTTLNASTENVDLIVSDVILPGKSGPEVVREIQTRSPGVRAMFISGYDDNEVENTGYKPELLLRKPFTIDQLRQAVRRALDHGRDERGRPPKGAIGSS